MLCWRFKTIFLQHTLNQPLKTQKNFLIQSKEQINNQTFYTGASKTKVLDYLENGKATSESAICRISWMLPPFQTITMQSGLSKQSITGLLSSLLICRNFLSLFPRHKHLPSPDSAKHWSSAPSQPGLNCYHLSLIPTLSINCIGKHFKVRDGQRG